MNERIMSTTRSSPLVCLNTIALSDKLGVITFLSHDGHQESRVVGHGGDHVIRRGIAGFFAAPAIWPTEVARLLRCRNTGFLLAIASPDEIAAVDQSDAGGDDAELGLSRLPRRPAR